MFPEDIPHWDAYTDTLKKDLAGNAFTTGVILAKVLALMVHSKALQSLAETRELAATDKAGHVKRRRLQGKQRPAGGPASAAAAAKPRRVSCTRVVLNQQSGREKLKDQLRQALRMRGLLEVIKDASRCRVCCAR